MSIAIIWRPELPNSVEAGKTDVLVYFSGHGIPVEGGDAMLLPSDARPYTAQTTGYSRDRLLKQLASLDARSVTAIFDACFTGTGKEGKALFEGGKNIGLTARPAGTFGNVLVISASRADQIAWVDKEAGMSLLTLHLLEGLSGSADTDGDASVTSIEIAAYLEEKVNKAARVAYHQRQQPVVSGDDRVLVNW